MALTSSSGALSLLRIAGGAGLEQADGELFLGVHAQHQHRQLGALDPQLFEHLKAAAARQGDIQHHHVIRIATGALQRLGPGGGFASHLHVAGFLQNLAQALPNHRVIIRN